MDNEKDEIRIYILENGGFNRFKMKLQTLCFYHLRFIFVLTSGIDTGC